MQVPKVTIRYHNRTGTGTKSDGRWKKNKRAGTKSDGRWKKNGRAGIKSVNFCNKGHHLLTSINSKKAFLKQYREF